MNTSIARARRLVSASANTSSAAAGAAFMARFDTPRVALPHRGDCAHRLPDVCRPPCGVTGVAALPEVHALT